MKGRQAQNAFQLAFKCRVGAQILNKSPVHFHHPPNSENTEKYFNIRYAYIL